MSKQCVSICGQCSLSLGTYHLAAASVEPMICEHETVFIVLNINYSKGAVIGILQWRYLAFIRVSTAKSSLMQHAELAILYEAWFEDKVPAETR